MPFRPHPLLLLAAAAVGSAQDVRFNRDIRPILSESCFTCHGPDEGSRSSPLRFDSLEGATVDLNSGGKAIVPGDPAASKLLERVASDDPVLRMPPAYKGHAKLGEREISLLRRWIEQGAQWEGHWAFLPPERPTPPAVRDAARVRNPIDNFVFARLEREGLAPSPEAAKETLIRRVTLDLTGLPPTPAEVDAFLADRSPGAYERVVDRLLESPRYGERMAFRWLEAARYADTNGYQNDEERDMHRWRDWVIDAFNRNLPFDKFTVWQIAGDLLPGATREQRIATGFNRNHRGNGELGIVPAEYHVEYVVDRVETTSTVWLGLTLGCARCHDHKYDPLTQKEFYRFYAYFNNVPDRGRYFKLGNTPPIEPAPTPEQQAALDRLDAERAELRRALVAKQSEIARGVEAWRPPADLDWRFDERLLASKYERETGAFDGQRHDDLGGAANFDFFDGFTLAARIRPETPTGGIVAKITPNANERGNVGYGLFLIDGKLHFRIESSDIDDRVRVETAESLPLGEWRHVAMTYDGSRLAAGVKFYIDGREAPARVIIDHSNNNTKSKDPLRIGFGPGPDERFRGLMQDVRIYDRNLSKQEVSVVASAETPAAIAALPADRRSAGQALKLRWAYLAETAPDGVRRAWAALRAKELEREKLFASFPTVMVMGERAEPRPTHVLNRGAYDAPGERVEPGVPAALGVTLPAGAPPNRLALAQWLVARDNPLTARVTVNRFWAMLFGRGIVETVEDFGSQGQWPTHPDLLDWLAVEFRESGWDVKGILRTVVTSAAYRQSSALTQELLENDPGNALYARGPRVRLPAEALRDQAMAVSGLLSGKLGGPSVRPYHPPGLWEELSNWGPYKHDTGDGLYRRSLYTFWKRTIAPPAMVTFDAAPRETCVVRETRTNTPLQSLGLMNDVTYVEAARKLAERMVREGGEAPAQRLAHGFRLATARTPTAEESEVLLRGLRRYRDRYLTSPADAEKLLSMGESPRDSSIPAPEHAAYTAVASMILNLDETVTKE